MFGIHLHRELRNLVASVLLLAVLPSSMPFIMWDPRQLRARTIARLPTNHHPSMPSLVPWNHHRVRTRRGDSVNTMYVNADDKYRQRYPDVSVIIPAYNEQDRILPTLKRYRHYLRQHEQRWNVNCFMYVVDDGSTDQTKEVVKNAFSAAELASSSSTPGVLCLSLNENCGKGNALATGIQAVLKQTKDRGGAPMLILTADADGSAEIADLDVLFQKMVELLQQSSSHLQRTMDWKQPALICGNRTYGKHGNDDDANNGRLVFRWGFRTVVRLCCGDLRTRDSQCGFKLLTLPAAALLYSNLHLQGWSHDVEVLYRAKLWNVPVAEAPVRWQDKTGSKLTAEGVLKVATRMFYDVLICRLNYDLGLWK